MTSRPTRLVLSLLATLAIAAPAAAQTPDPEVRARLDSLEQALKVLARLREIERDSVAAAQATRPSVSIGTEGFVFRSADGAFRLKLTGDVQMDTRFYLNDATQVGTDAFFIRRARPMIEGTIFRNFDFRLMPDFGQGSALIYEAYFDARLSPGFVIRAGKVKPPLGLERLQADVDVRFAERGYPTNLVPNRDIGLQVWGELARGTVQYAAGVFDGLPDLGFGDGDVSDAKDFAGRLFIVPFAARKERAPVDLGFGFAFGAGDERGTVASPATSNLRSAGQLVVFKYRSNGQAAGTVVEDGRRTRIAPQAYLYSGSFGAMAEYTQSKHTVRLDQDAIVSPHRGWQVASSFVIGGSQSFTGVRPKRPFDPSKNRWGALELAARYEGTDVDDSIFPVFADPATSVRSVRTWSIGLTWHLLRRTKIVLDYERTTFIGGAPNGGDRAPENFLVSRFQLAY